MRWWLLLALFGCGGSHHAKADASAGPSDAVADVAADAPVDAAIDAAPDLDPSCPVAPTILVDANPRRITTMANVGDVLFVAAYNPNNASDSVVLSVDPATGASLAAPLVTAASGAVWPGPDAAYATEGRANGSIWRLVPGQPPVELITGRASPFAAASDGTYVYWNEGSTIERRLIAGGTIEQVMTGCDNPFRIVVDATDVYCLAFQQGDVLRAPKDGSAAAAAVPYAGGAGAHLPAATLVQDGSDLYLANFYNNPEIWAGPKPAGPLALVTQSPDLGRYLGLAVAPYHFYVTNQEGYVEQISRSTHAVHKIQILNQTTYGAPALDPIVWNGQLLVTAEDYTSAGQRYVLHCAD